MAEPIAIKHTLHGLRVNYGLTREEVAECIGVGPNAVTRYEKGAHGMKGVVRDKFARFYGVDQGQIDFDDFNPRTREGCDSASLHRLWLKQSIMELIFPKNQLF